MFEKADASNAIAKKMHAKQNCHQASVALVPGFDGS